MTRTDSLSSGGDTNPQEPQMLHPEDGIIVVDRTSTSSGEVALMIPAISTTTAPAVGTGEIIEPNFPLVELPFDFEITNSSSHQEDAPYSWNVEPFVMDMSDRTAEESLDSIRQVDQILNTIAISYPSSEHAARRREQSGTSESDINREYYLKQ